MTLTVIALLSIVSGIVGANIFGRIQSKYTFGLTGNTIAGVFGSIFIIKSFGRLGFNPYAIIEKGIVSWNLLAFNLIASIFGGVILILILTHLKRFMH
mgnify:CR=1 FL=1|tara:strand:- start:3286 stop:3579 length:294 start_codon:yes stop_codon:yes gene_type:complete